jgi:hypothetical protein
MSLSPEQLLDMSARYKALLGRLMVACQGYDVRGRFGLWPKEMAHLLLIDHAKAMEGKEQPDIEAFLAAHDDELKSLGETVTGMRQEAQGAFATMDVQKRFGVSVDDAVKLLLEGLSSTLNKKDGSATHMNMFLIVLQDGTYDRDMEYAEFTPIEVKRLTAIVEKSPYMRQK